MTSKNPESPIKPQVIDLEAEDITLDEPSPPPPPAPPPPTAKKSKSSSPWIIAALLAGAIAGGWLYKDVLSSYLPSNELTAAKASIETLQAQNKTLAEQVASISAASDQLKAQVTSITSDIASGKEASSTETGTLEARIAAAEAAAKAAKADIEKLKTLPSGSAPATPGTDTGALAGLAQRLDAVEKDVASLKTAGKPSDQSALAATLSQSLSDLKAKIASGSPYGDEFDRISRVVPAAAGLDTVGQYASEGLPAPAGLAKELTELIPLLPKPETDAIVPDDSYAAGIWNMMKGLITIRKIGEADWPTLAAQSAALAESGDLKQAIEKIDAADGAKPVALSNWRDRAAARLNLENALEETAKAVARQIASTGATP
jgi:hypothetical protein